MAAGLARARFAIGPVGAGTGIEQHADQRQVDLRPGPFGRVDIAQGVVKLAGAVHAAGFKMPPAAVVRDFEVRVAHAGEFGHHDGGGRHGAIVDEKPGRFAAPGPRQQCQRPFAYRVCRA